LLDYVQREKAVRNEIHLQNYTNHSEINKQTNYNSSDTNEFKYIITKVNITLVVCNYERYIFIMLAITTIKSCFVQTRRSQKIFLLTTVMIYYKSLYMYLMTYEGRVLYLFLFLYPPVLILRMSLELQICGCCCCEILERI
jgi:hypothetical protein